MGYAYSIVGVCLFTGISLSEGNLDINRQQFWWLSFHPIPNYCRIIYLLADKCAWHDCISDWKDVDSEMHRCLLMLYLNSIFYFVLAVYLEQVVPSAFSIPKHPLFFVEELIKDKFPELYRKLFSQDVVMMRRVSLRLDGEDADVSQER